MNCTKLRVALLAAALVTASSARADHQGAAAATQVPCESGGAVAAAPATRTVQVREWVPETYQSTRTVYRTESKVENYTAYKTEVVPETRTVTVCVTKRIPETKEVMVRRCVATPVTEERTIMKSNWTCKPVTTTVRRCVDRGHWECRQVPCDSGSRHKVRKLFHRHKDCCEESSCEPCAVPMKTVRVWVPCKVWEEVPCTVMKRVCEQVPCKAMVTTCKYEWREEKKLVTCCRCVTEQVTKTCTVNVCKCVPYQATRTVCVCVPHTEACTATRMVCKLVDKQLPVSASETTCCSSPCARKCKSRCSGSGQRGHGSSCCD